jgi:hypothetical protein
MIYIRYNGLVSKFKELETFLKKAYKGRKYGDKDFYSYHLVGVAELAMEKAREAKLDPELAYAIGLSHDYLEDFKDYFSDFMEVVERIPWEDEGFHFDTMCVALAELQNFDDFISYYHYIAGISDPYALLVKEADIEFHLLQDNAPKLKKYALYCFAFKYIRIARLMQERLIF